MQLAVAIQFELLLATSLLSARLGKIGEYGNVIPRKPDMLTGNFLQQHYKFRKYFSS